MLRGKRGGLGRTEMLETETPGEECSAERRNLAGLGKFAEVFIRRERSFPDRYAKNSFFGGVGD